MTEETQKELLRIVKRAMAFVSADCKDRDLVFELRDVIRKAETEIKGDRNAPDEMAGTGDELH